MAIGKRREAREHLVQQTIAIGWLFEPPKESALMAFIETGVPSSAPVEADPELEAAIQAEIKRQREQHGQQR